MKRGKNGFTLAELLIVVAIVAVLVAVSIPVFNTKLEKARESTDWANMRAAKAAAVTAYINEDTVTSIIGGEPHINTFGKEDVTCYYDAASGKLVGLFTKISGYGKGTAAKGGCDTCSYCSVYDDEGPYNENSDVHDMYLTVYVTTECEITLVWTPITW